MKVLLVNASIRPKGAPYIFPIHIALLASALIGRGHDVRAVDLLGPGDPPRQLRDLLARGPYDLIGVSYRNLPIAWWAVGVGHLHDVLRQVRPHARLLVLGGAAVSLFSELFLRDLPAADAVVLGEGEEALAAIADDPPSIASVPGVCVRGPGGWTVNPRRPMPAAAIPELRDVPGLWWDAYESLAVQTIRGCPKGCTFCTTPFLRGTEVRARDLDAVRADLRFLAARGVRQIIFIDSKFNLIPERADRILDMLIADRSGFEWEGFLRPARDLDPAFLAKAQRAGCAKWHLDICSGDEGWLRRLHHDVDLGAVEHTAHLLKDAGARGIYYFTYCLPGETVAQELRTLSLMRRLRAAGVPWGDMMLFPYFPFPHIGLDGGRCDALRAGPGWHVKRNLSFIARPSTAMFATMFLPGREG